MFYAPTIQTAGAMKIQVLGSTSSGNATLIWNTRTRILVDCGLPSRYTHAALRIHGLSIADLTGVVITHTHADHVNRPMLANIVKFARPIYCPACLADELQRSHEAARMAADNGLLRAAAEPPWQIGDFGIQPFAVSHDSPGGCFGYRIEHSGSSASEAAAVATDLGDWDDRILRYCAHVDALVLESNYDEDLLDRTGRPAWLRRRIRKSHLSNEQSAAFIAAVCAASTRPPRSTILAHISQQANTNERAYACCRKALDTAQFVNTAVYPSHMRKTSAIIEIGAGASGDASYHTLPLFNTVNPV